MGLKLLWVTVEQFESLGLRDCGLLVRTAEIRRSCGDSAELRRSGGDRGREMLVFDRIIQTGGGRLQVSSEATEMDLPLFSPPRLRSVWGEGDRTS